MEIPRPIEGVTVPGVGKVREKPSNLESYNIQLLVNIIRYNVGGSHECTFMFQIFVEFEDADQCRQAHSALAGRKFANRVVVTSFFPLMQYQQKNFIAE